MTKTVSFMAADARLGSSSAAQRTADAIAFADAAPGFAIWGPYAALGKGRYTARFLFDPSVRPSGRLIMDACASRGEKTLGAHEFDLGALANDAPVITLAFELDRHATDVEVRLLALTGFSGRITSLEIHGGSESNSALDLLGRTLRRDIQAADVGARWTIPSPWLALGDRLRVIGFEPDAPECARLNAQAGRNMTFYPYALGAADGTARLHLTREPACSSLYPPNRTLYTDYPVLADIEPVRTLDVPVRSFDGLAAEIGLPALDILKLDTQGSELDILRGATRVIATCSLIDVEVEFNPIYDGQNLYGDVDRFMREAGFVLWRFNELCHYAPKGGIGTPQALSVHHAGSGVTTNTFEQPDGQLFWAQAHYVRKAFTRWGDGPFAGNPVCAATVMAVYGYWDMALDILRKCGEPALFREITDALGGSP